MNQIGPLRSNRCPRSVERSGVRQNAGTKLAVIFAVVLDERQVLNTIERADGVGIGHINAVREHLDGHLDLVTAHGLGLDGELGAPKCTHDIVADGLTRVVDDHHVYARLVLVARKAGNHHHDHHRREPHERIHAGTRSNARGNGPKQIQQVERVLDRRTIADDGQSTDHTERDDHVGRDRKRHHTRKHAHAHERHGKAARVHDADKKALVHVIDQDAHGERHEQRQADLGRVDLTKPAPGGTISRTGCGQNSVKLTSITSLPGSRTGCAGSVASKMSELPTAARTFMSNVMRTVPWSITHGSRS